MRASFSRFILLPLVCVVLASVVEKLLALFISPPLYVPFLAAVAVSALYGGVIAGLVAILASALFLDYFFLEPLNSIGIDSPRDWNRLCIYLSVALLITLLTRERFSRLQVETQRKATQNLLSEIAQELRAPMTSVLGWIDILRGGLDSRDTQRVHEFIKRQLRLQNMLLEDMLCAAPLEEGKLALREMTVEVYHSVDIAIDIARPLALKKGVDLRWQKPADAPLLFVKGDNERLVQVLWNLLANAIKFSRHEGIVTVKVGRNRENAEVEVSDSIISVRCDQLKQFSRKWRQGDPQEGFAGVGLGLWVARSIAELHHGRIEVLSNEGLGARFTVRLPLAEPQPIA
jgi:K+-sensing histidine kinase KdpD